VAGRRLLGGTAVGIAVERMRGVNLVLGCLGAIVGGLLFHIFTIPPDLDSISISLRDLASAFVGSLVVLALVWIWQRFGRRSAPAS
jgi:uncharacterized membrane protein YeaQ/YmgE (transglycosylase-associated protein family)